ncbi:transposase [Dysgonomonas termitidis]|uniref:Transposase n=1 Tax=Dysgonomonas termitidis TaxID=1516126 RepID=A0ABV9KS18_9BACT
MNHKEPERRKTTDAEIITVVLIAARCFGGNIETSLSFVRSTGLMPDMLGKSRFNRRLHNIGEFLSQLFFCTGQAIKNMNLETTYCIDSFPVAVCQNIRITNSRIVKGEEYRGKCVSKRVYFYGFKVHMIVTSDGILENLMIKINDFVFWYFKVSNKTVTQVFRGSNKQINFVDN